MKKLILFMSVMVIGLFALVGCGAKEEAKETSTNTETKEKVSEKFTLEYPAHLKERFGDKIELDKVPEKIIVMTATPVQSLYELGIKLDAIPENKTVAWPADLEAERIPFEMTTMDTESIISRKPDLLILSEHSAQQYQKTFEDNGIKCYFTSAFKDIATVKEELNLFAKAFGKENEEKTILEKFTKVETEISKVAEKSENPKTVILTGYPLEYVQNEEGFVGQMLSLFKIDNITKDAKAMAGMAPINMEDIVSKNPELIIAIGDSDDEKVIEEEYKKEFEKNSKVWNNIDAVKNNNIVYLDKRFKQSAGIKIIDNLEVLKTKFSEGVKK